MKHRILYMYLLDYYTKLKYAPLYYSFSYDIKAPTRP